MTEQMADYLRKLRDGAEMRDGPSFVEALCDLGFMGILLPNGGWGITPRGLEALEAWDKTNA